MSKEILTEHWGIDETAAGQLSADLSDEELGRLEHMIEPLEKGAAARDKARKEIGDIYTGASDKRLIVVGPCSLDGVSDYAQLLDCIQKLQQENDSAVIALRANGAKPRTSGGWTGLISSHEPGDRLALETAYREAFNRGIPIVTEVTQSEQLGTLAPYLSGYWLGARDVESTALRAMASAYHLPVAIKNGQDGSPQIVENATKAIGMSSADAEGSGVDLGTLGATSENMRGVSTGTLEVGEGNKRIAIIARGYTLPDTMTAETKHAEAMRHLSAMCLLGEKAGAAVLIDVSHSVAPMFDTGKKDQGRALRVLDEFHRALEAGKLDTRGVLRGVMAEAGVSKGRTDPNYDVTEPGKCKALREMFKTSVRLLR